MTHNDVSTLTQQTTPHGFKAALGNNHVQSEGKTTIQIYTDGACIGNPGPGGYACLIRSQHGEAFYSGQDKDTTNNRMEMMAAIIALQELPEGTTATLYSDSNLLIQGMNTWRHTWTRNGWKNSSRKPVMNRDLWEQLIELNERHHINWKWIKGHDGHKHNETVDKVANEMAHVASTHVLPIDKELAEAITQNQHTSILP